MGQRSIIRSGGGLLAALAFMALAVACDNQSGESTGSAADSEPLAADSANADAPSSSPGPPPPPEGAFLAQLPPERTSQLANLGVDVVVPGAVPPAFTVADIRTEQAATDSGNPTNGSSYIVVYQDANNRCFGVEFASDGIGDPPATENRLPIQPPLFGDQAYGLNYGPFADAAMQTQFPGSNLYTDWLMGPSGAYRLVGASYIGSLFPSFAGCQDIAPEEAVSIVESFTVLSPDGVGDGEALN